MAKKKRKVGDLVLTQDGKYIVGGILWVLSSICTFVLGGFVYLPISLVCLFCFIVSVIYVVGIFNTYDVGAPYYGMSVPEFWFFLSFLPVILCVDFVYFLFGVMFEKVTVKKNDE